MAGTLVQQVKVLVWRNFKLKWRAINNTIAEIFFPIWFAVILVVIASLIPNSTLPAVPSFAPVNVASVNVSGHSGDLAYAPAENALVAAIMTGAAAALGRPPPRAFDTEDDLYAAYNVTPVVTPLWAAVIFDLDANGDLGDNVKYTIRQNGTYVIQTETTMYSPSLCRDPTMNDPTCPSAAYYGTGFVPLQRAIDEAILRTVLGVDLTVDFEGQQYPKGELTTDNATISTLAAIYLVVAFQPLLQFLIMSVISEKEKKIKLGLTLMGMRNSSFFLGWLIVYATVMLLSVLVVTIIITQAGLIRHGNFFIIFCLMYLYCLSTCALAFVMSPLFNNAKVAGGVGSLVVSILSVLYVPLNATGTPASAGVKWAVSLLSPVALALGMGEAVYLEAFGTGTQFDNINVGAFTPGYSVSSSLIMLLVDIFLYLMIAWYLDNVVPSGYGVARDPLFLFRPSYWCPPDPLAGESQPFMAEMPAHEDYEAPHGDGEHRIGIEINNVTKEFPPSNRLHSNVPVRALNGVTLQLEEGEIFGLLGHNGAGKSTLVSVLCGITSPTTGNIKIYGLDSVRDVDAIRRQMGVCLQENILFDQLTVREHIEMVAGLKGITDPNAVDRVIQDVDLVDHQTKRALGLSGGQKRKLSVAMALIGDPKILFLDEPTSGMDPSSRRQVWDCLLAGRRNRVTLLTTHFMDEADILADRKAILSHGRVRCVGSSLFLKTRFGLGYVLTALKSNTAPASADGPLASLVREHVPDAEITRDVGHEIVFRLPLQSAPLFAALFDAMDARLAEIGVEEYSVSMTTLEEVFLRLENEQDEEQEEAEGAPAEDDKAAADKKTKKEHTLQSYSPFHVDMSQTYLGQLKLGEQFRLLSWYRLLQSLRSPSITIFTLILPSIFILIGLIIYTVVPTGNSRDQPALALSGATLFPKAPAVPVQQIVNVSADALLDVLPFDTKLSDNPMFYEDLQGSSSPGAYAFYAVDEDALRVRVMYDDTAAHAMPAYLADAVSAFAVMLSGTLGRAANLTISTFSHPMQIATRSFDGLAYTAIYLIGNGLCFPPGSFIVDVVKDRQKKLKHQMEVMGARRFAYWLSMFAKCISTYGIAGLLVIILIAAFQVQAFTGLAILPLILLVFTYIPMMLSLVFVLSFLFKDYETAQSVVPPLLNILGLIPYFVVAGLDQGGVRETARLLHYIFLVLIPPYGVMGGLHYVNMIYVINYYTGKTTTMGDYFNLDNNVIMTIVVIVLQFFIFAGLLYVLDMRPNKAKAIAAAKASGGDEEASIDETAVVDDKKGVLRERKRSLQPDFVEKHPIAVRRLRRTVYYPDPSPPENARLCTRPAKLSKNIVDNVSFGVSPGECLGLLGPNGAGKTTTMSVLTADVLPDGGEAFLSQHNVVSERRLAMQHLGYCPQFDALFDELTPLEHLRLYARLKGVPADQVDARAMAFIDGLGIREYANRQARHLSGGTKRKVSFAMAMIGNPEVVFLDEPSTGMDPSSRRFIWDVILDHIKGRASILTTHSMDEADALCTRIAIMVNGRLECIGTSQHLKNAFGDGAVLELNVAPARAEEARNAVSEMFGSGATLMEAWGGYLSYKINRGAASLGSIFGGIEARKEQLGIEEYSFSQTTLEQIFIAFARNQIA